MSTTTGGAERQSQPASVHLDYLDGLRCLAALSVMLTHTVAIVYNPFPPEIARWAMFARFSVDLFIVLSGYCLMLPVMRRGELRGGAKDFFKRRARRILPPYYAALGVTLLLIWTVLGKHTGSFWDDSLPVNAKNLASHLLLLQNIYGGNKIDAPMWTVSVEWWIYFLFPALVFAWRRFGSTTTTLAAVVLSYVCYFATEHTRLAGLTCNFVGLFAMGMLGAAITHDKGPKWLPSRDSRLWLYLTAIPMIANLGLRLYFGQEWASRYLGMVDLVAGIGSASLLVLTSQAVDGPGRAIRKFLNLRPFVAIGTFAYSIYLMHFPLMQLLWQYGARLLHLSQPNTVAVLMIVGCPIAVGLAYLFHRAFELPFMVNKRKVAPVEPAKEPALSAAGS